MGDLRNKVAKELRDARHRLYMARRYPNPPEPPPFNPACAFCGLEGLDNISQSGQPIQMYQCQTGWMKPDIFVCECCVPLWLGQEIKCRCGGDAVAVQGNQAYCEKCRPKRREATNG